MVKNVLNTLRKKQKNNKGFSLVELIVVIAIMAVLVGQQLKSSVETDISDNENIDTVTIVINGQTATATITPKTGTGTATTETAKLKSTGWRGVTYTLDTSTGKWDATTYADTTNKAVNEKSPNKNMDEVFSIS